MYMQFNMSIEYSSFFVMQGDAIPSVHIEHKYILFLFSHVHHGSDILECPLFDI